MMGLVYENSQGIRIDLSTFPYYLQDEPLYDFEWEADLTSSGTKKSILTRFTRNSKRLQMDLVIHADSQAQFEYYLDQFFRITEYDVIAKTPGRLILKDTGEYISCYVVSSENSMWQNGIRTNVKKIAFLFTYPFWIKEVSRSFLPQTDTGEGDSFLDYNHDYAYDYMHGVKGVREWYIDHYTDSEFEMTIFGYCVNPVIRINGYPYQIYTTLEANDYLVIKSKDNEVTKWISGVVQQNAFDFRSKENSVFERIPSGKLIFTWEGTYGFDLKLFLERSEPQW